MALLDKIDRMTQVMGNALEKTAGGGVIAGAVQAAPERRNWSSILGGNGGGAGNRIDWSGRIFGNAQGGSWTNAASGGDFSSMFDLSGFDRYAAIKGQREARETATGIATTNRPLTETGAAGGAGAAGLSTDQWAGTLNEEAARYADAPELAEVAQAVMQLESGGKADAEGVVVTQGPYAGQRAQGLMQIMPGNYPGVDLKDPRTNIQKGLEMLYERYKRYGSWDKAVAAYFGAIDGAGNITGAQDDNGTSGWGYVNTVNQHRQTIQQARARQAQPQGGATGQAWQATGRAMIGTPYQLGGRRAAGGKVGPGIPIDCSEFTAYLLEQDGVTLPWNAQMQHDQTQRVAANQLQPGDLVFFQGTYDTGRGEYITHVGRYLGNGQFIHAGSQGVQVASLSDPYWTKHYAGGGRVAQRAQAGGDTRGIK